ncbi:MAG: ankyrin repeat domain-containing protein [Alphaproteobacteria bacterium]|nr:ankyrin repeat domain-containing protein [Alphaproteobacteria bacterium]
MFKAFKEHGAQKTPEEKGLELLEELDHDRSSYSPAFCLELIKGGADINIQDRMGMTALMWAVWRKDEDITDALIKGGAKIDIKNKEGQTALMIAAQSGSSSPTVLRTLIDSGADINMQGNGSARSALMWAVEKGNADAVRVLIDCGAKVDIQDKDGITALMMAAWYGDTNVAHFLIESGADPLLKDNKGRLPQDMAAGRHSSLSVYLTEAAFSAADKAGTPRSHKIRRAVPKQSM